ncbi:four helix bundle protein [Pedobacter miscanthi]|uniref:Diversity-generating retroelement protein bAvd family protein n=1 Tax=Pedobacter miscanthi TaxID=2259170 RepID=A0A366L8L5_9SPHI|nr:four helix bundle protein [Pedobacter miscanthi]RBQ10217.1 diversity-generating retroelement protein bAvd family protein [Pedobacter miscanthi]
MGDFSDLLVYKKSFELAMDIFEISKTFPKDETYSLTDQIRRSSRSTNICLVEAYRKRRYKAHFISKLSDSDMENSETKGWLKFAFECKYILKDKYEKLALQSDEVGKLLNHMINFPEKYGVV